MDRIVVTGPSSHPPGGAEAGGPRRLADAGDRPAEGAVWEVRMLHLASHPAPPAWLCRTVRAVGPPAWLVPDCPGCGPTAWLVPDCPGCGPTAWLVPDGSFIW